MLHYNVGQIQNLNQQNTFHYIPFHNAPSTVFLQINADYVTKHTQKPK